MDPNALEGSKCRVFCHLLGQLIHYADVLASVLIPILINVIQLCVFILHLYEMHIWPNVLRI